MNCEINSDPNDDVNIGNGPHTLVCKTTGDDKVINDVDFRHFTGEANCFDEGDGFHNVEGRDLLRNVLEFGP